MSFCQQCIFKPGKNVCSYFIVGVQLYIFTCYGLDTGLGLKTGFTEGLQLLSTNNCDNPIDLRTLHITATTAHIHFFRSLAVVM
jgi:hypothetical protein